MTVEMKNKNVIFIRIAGVLWFLAAVCAFLRRSGLVDELGTLLLVGMIVFAAAGLSLAAVFIIRCRKTMKTSAAEQVINDVYRKMQDEVYGNADDGKKEIALVSGTIGKFVYRRKPDWYECINAVWLGDRVFVSFRVPGGSAPEAALGNVEKLFGEGKKTDDAVRAEIKKSYGANVAESAVPALLSIEADGSFKFHYRFGADADSGTMSVMARFIAYGDLESGIKKVELNK